MIVVVIVIGPVIVAVNVNVNPTVIVPVIASDPTSNTAAPIPVLPVSRSGGDGEEASDRELVDHGPDRDHGGVHATATITGPITITATITNTVERPRCEGG